MALGLAISPMAYSQDENTDTDTPWLKGAEHMPLGPTVPAPLMDMSICGDDGAIPTELTEDVPVTVTANSAIFYDEAPSVSTDGHEFSEPQWVDEKPVALWFFNDWTRKKTFMASTTEEIAGNQMVIIPTMPTEAGSITCHSSRQMQFYRESDGKLKKVFANSSAAAPVKVLDITPPTCGFEISVENGMSGQCWPVENPPDQYPLPKTADMCFSGALFGASDEDRVVQGFELGSSMILSDDEAITLSSKDVIRVKVIGDDNFKLNSDKLKYGVCAGAGGGDPTPVSPENEETIDFSTFAIPEKPYLYLDATDVSGNRQVLYVPLNIQ